MDQEKIEDTLKEAILGILALEEKASCYPDISCEYLQLTLERMGWDIKITRLSKQDDPATRKLRFIVYGKYKESIFTPIITIPLRELKERKSGMSLEKVKEKIKTCFNDTAENLRDFSGFDPCQVDEQIILALKDLIVEWMLPDDLAKTREELEPVIEAMEPGESPSSVEDMKKITDDLFSSFGIPAKLLENENS